MKTDHHVTVRHSHLSGVTASLRRRLAPVRTKIDLGGRAVRTITSISDPVWGQPQSVFSGVLVLLPEAVHDRARAVVLEVVRLRRDERVEQRGARVLDHLAARAASAGTTPGRRTAGRTAKGSSRGRSARTQRSAMGPAQREGAAHRSGARATRSRQRRSRSA
jgi:hypothetical protein